jgi:hypothetical protein
MIIVATAFAAAAAVGLPSCSSRGVPQACKFCSDWKLLCVEMSYFVMFKFNSHSRIKCNQRCLGLCRGRSSSIGEVSDCQYAERGA